MEAGTTLLGAALWARTQGVERTEALRRAVMALRSRITSTRVEAIIRPLAFVTAFLLGAVAWVVFVDMPRSRAGAGAQFRAVAGYRVGGWPETLAAAPATPSQPVQSPQPAMPPAPQQSYTPPENYGQPMAPQQQPLPRIVYQQAPLQAQPAPQPDLGAQADSQFRTEVSQAAYQHSVAENQLVHARQFGGREERHRATVALARSLDYDIAAVNHRLVAGTIAPDRANLLRAELPRLQGEQARQLQMAVLDDADYAMAIAESESAIADYGAGLRGAGDDAGARSSENFQKISAHNEQALNGMREAEAQLRALAGSG